MSAKTQLQLKERILPKSVGFTIAAGFHPREDMIVSVGGPFNRLSDVFVRRSPSFEATHCGLTARFIASGLWFSPTGDEFCVTCQITSGVEIWNTATLKRSRILSLIVPGALDYNDKKYATSHVGHLAFSPSGRWLAAGCWDCRAKLWDFETGNLHELNPHEWENVDYVAFLPGEKTLLTANTEHFHLWDVETRELLWKRPTKHRDECWTHLLPPDSEQLISVSDEGILRLTDLKTFKLQESKLKFKRVVTHLAFCPRSHLLAIALDDGRLYLWSLSEQRFVCRLRPSNDRISAVSFSPTGNSLFVSAGDETLYQLNSP